MTSARNFLFKQHRPHPIPTLADLEDKVIKQKSLEVLKIPSPVWILKFLVTNSPDLGGGGTGGITGDAGGGVRGP